MDNWKHRSKKMRCSSCMWFVEKIAENIETAPAPKNSLGRCRRNAPTMNGFPAVFSDDWCGNHKLNENSL